MTPRSVPLLSSATPHCTLIHTSSRPARRWRGAWIAAAAVLALGVTGARAQNVFQPEPVASTSSEQSVTVSSPSGGTVKTVEVLTAGVAGGEFAAGIGVSTCTNATLAAGATCTQAVTFTPATPGLRMGAVVLLDNGGNILGTGYIAGTGQGGLGVLAPGNVTIVAGTLGLYTSVNDGQQATAGQLYLPNGVVLDGAGNMYIADSVHNRVRMVCGAAQKATIAGTTCTTAGIISTIVGNGNSGYAGDSGAAALATVTTPNGVAVDGAGNLYIADSGNNAIRMIWAATGIITTVAGNGSTGNSNTPGGAGVGDGGLATSANLNGPFGIALDGSGNLYIADTYDHRIREVNAATGIIGTIAGTGATGSNGGGGYNGDNIAATSAKLNYPYGIAFDPAGNLYIADEANNRIREVASVGGAITAASQITTLAGTGSQGGSDTCGTAPAPASSTALFSPQSVAVDAAGNIYIADTQNAGIRKVNPVTGMLSTLLQNNCGSVYFEGVFAPVDLYGPKGLYLDGYGNLYISDSLDMVIREMEGNYVAVDDLETPTRQGSQSGPFNQTLENDGNAPLDLTSINHDANSALATSTTCGTGAPYLAVLADCNLGADFAPSVAGNPLTGNITVADDTQPGPPGVTASNSPLDVEIFGNATAVNSTTTTITSTPNPSNFKQYVVFSITVNTGSGTGNLSGTVTVTDTYQSNTVPLATNLTLTLNGAGTTGTATFSISTLGVGQHTIVASYSGDSGHFAGKSTDNGVAPLIQSVVEGTGTTLTSNQNPSLVGQSVSFTATVANTGGGVVPLGTVQFMDGANPLGSPVALTASGSNGVATYTTSTLANGVHPITAVYSGDAADQIQGGTSNTVNQDVQAAATLQLASSLNPSYFGNSVTFTATITSAATQPATGTVIFLDNGVQIGTGTLAGNPAVATFTTAALAVGTHPITATYSGDLYNSTAATAAPTNQIVNLAQTATIVTAVPSPGIAGVTETIVAVVTVTAGSVTPAGTVTFTSGTTVLGTASLLANGTATITPKLAPGNYQVVATYAGNTQADDSASSPLPLAIAQATTQTALTVYPTPGLASRPITFTATVTGNGAVPTGTVNFTANGNSIGAAQLSASGVAAITVSTLPVGSYTIEANYGGDTNDGLSSSSPAALNVVLATTATTLTATPNPALVSQTVTFTAKVTGNGGTPTGTVNFIANGNPIGSAPLVAGSATLTDSTLPAGSYTIEANYGGDTNDGLSSSSTATLSVVLATTATALTATPNPALVSQTVTFSAKVNGNGGTPTGTVSFIANGNPIGSVPLVAGTATLTDSALPAGAYTVTASYSGDNADAISASSSLSETIGLIPTATGLGTSTTSGPSPQVLLVASVLNTATGPAPAGTVSFMSGSTALGASAIDSNGVATLVPNLLSSVNYSITAVYQGDVDHSASTSQPVTIDGTPNGFNLTVSPTTMTMKTSENATIAVNLASNGGFSDTIALGCGSLPAGMTCQFSPMSVSLAANGMASAQLSIDTNNPLSGGNSAMNHSGSSSSFAQAGLLLPFSAFFGWLFWRLRRRSAGLLTLVTVLALTAAALVATGCSGISTGGVAPGTYNIQIVGTGSNSNVIHYQNETVTITQ